MPPGEFRLEEFLPYQLSVVAGRTARLFSQRYAEVYGLTIPEWRVLATIARFGSVSPTTVGEWTAMDKVKVSRAAATLASRGFIRQSPDPKDGRGRLLRMTRKGIAVHQTLVPVARELEATLIDSVGRTHWATLGKVLARLDGQVVRLSDQNGGDATE
jgi:DNA-binding MarR family transcriptional regulator